MYENLRRVPKLKNDNNNDSMYVSSNIKILDLVIPKIITHTSLKVEIITHTSLKVGVGDRGRRADA